MMVSTDILQRQGGRESAAAIARLMIDKPRNNPQRNFTRVLPRLIC